MSYPPDISSLWRDLEYEQRKGVYKESFDRIKALSTLQGDVLRSGFDIVQSLYEAQQRVNAISESSNQATQEYFDLALRVFEEKQRLQEEHKYDWKPDFELSLEPHTGFSFSTDEDASPFDNCAFGGKAEEKETPSELLNRVKKVLSEKQEKLEKAKNDDADARQALLPDEELVNVARLEEAMHEAARVRHFNKVASAAAGSILEQLASRAMGFVDRI